VEFILSKKIIIRSVGRLQTKRILRRSHMSEITWLGDSHAAFLSGTTIKSLNADLNKSPLIWLGPRLMFSVSKKGFPDFLFSKSNAGLLKGRSTLVISLGEIDVRAHLSKKGSNVDLVEWVGNYVLKVLELSKHLEPLCTIIVGPVPPSPHGEKNSRLPTVGPLDRRIHFTSTLELTLEEKIRDVAKLFFIPLSPLLAKTDGTLRENFVLDGIHTSEEACKVLSKTIKRVLESAKS
jgi:hypothetical protein